MLNNWELVGIILWPGFRCGGTFQLRSSVLYGEKQYLQIWSLTTLYWWTILLKAVTDTTIKFYLTAWTFWQGFCFQLEASSDPWLIVGLLILAPPPSPPWNSFFLYFDISPPLNSSCSRLWMPASVNYTKYFWYIQPFLLLLSSSSYLTVSWSSLVSLPTAPTWRTSSTMQKLSSCSVLVQLKQLQYEFFHISIFTNIFVWSFPLRFIKTPS